MSRQRSWMRFEESIKSKYTKHNYVSHLKSFMSFINIKHSDELITIQNKQLQIYVEDYLIYLKNTINPNSLPTKFLGLKHFFVMNQIQLDWDLIHKMYPSKLKPIKLRCWTRSEIQQIMNTATNSRDRALILFLASTGVRIGIFDHPLQFGHTIKMPEGCMGITNYAGTVDEYWSFLTPQATTALRCYVAERVRHGENLTNASPLFRNLFSMKKVHDVRPLQWSGARSVIARHVNKSAVKRIKNKLRYDVQVDHGFRKFFNTTLKLDNQVNYNIAEKLMGHKNGLDGIYLTPTIDQCFQEFRKVMHSLEI